MSTPTSHKLRKFILGRKRIASVSIYGCITVLPRLASATLAILYASVFSLQQYGVFGVLSVILGLLGIVVDLGIPQSILRNYYDLHQNWQLAREYVATVVLSASVASLALLPLVGLALYFGWHWLHIGHIYVLPYVILILTISYCERSSTLFGTVLRAVERPVDFAAGALGQAVVTFSVGVTLVFFVHLRVSGALLALLAGQFASAAIYLLILRFRVGVHGGKIDWAAIKPCLSFGLPLVPTRLAGWAREAGLRPSLLNVVPLASVGLFSFASSVSAFPHVASSAVELVLSPYYYKQRITGSEGFTQRVENFGAIFLALLTPFWACAILFSPDIIRIFTGQRYQASVPICVVLLCASFVRTQQPFLTRQINFLRQTWIMPIATIPCAILSIGLAILFSRLFGIAAVGWAVLIADALLFAVLSVAIRAYEHVHHPIALTLGLAGGLAVLATWTARQPMTVEASNIAVKLLILALISVSCFAIWIWPNRHFILNIARS